MVGFSFISPSNLLAYKNINYKPSWIVVYATEVRVHQESFFMGSDFSSVKYSLII